MHRPSLRRLSAATVLAAGLPLGLLAGTADAASASPVAPATAATTSSLDNTDPIATGCWDANAYVAAGPAPIYEQNGGSLLLLGYVRNWYSPDCGTNWSEVYTADGSSQFLDVSVTRESDGYESSLYSPTGNDAYSNQVYAPDVTACAVGFIDGNFNEACA